MTSKKPRGIEGFALVLLGVALAAPALADTLAHHPVAVAIRHGDCPGAVKLLNPDVALNDRDTSFLAGRMLDEGICVEVNPPAAGHYFAHAAELGDRTAALDYAAKVGLGEGFDQSYERAGELCRSSGIDAARVLSDYSLGYACTLRSLAGKLLRVSLPLGAFRPDTGDVRVEFAPASPQINIRETPMVGRDKPQTGSRIGPPLINAESEIGKAWRGAIALAPKPDASRLDNKALALTLDVDMDLEAGMDVKRQTGADISFAPVLLRGDVHAAGVH